MNNWKSYNDVMNEGGEGYNPFEKPLHPIKKKSSYTKSAFIEPKSEPFFKLNGEGNLIRLSHGLKIIDDAKTKLKGELGEYAREMYENIIVDYESSIKTAE